MSGALDLARLARLASAHRGEIAQAGSEEAVATWLYERWYLDPDGLEEEAAEKFPFDGLGGPLGALIARAAPWEIDWVVLSASPDGSIVAGRGNVTRLQHAGSYASGSRFGLPPVPGEQVSISPFLSFIDPPTGQWAAQSPEPPIGPLVRTYFNVGPSGVGAVIDAFLAKLAGGLRFSMKCPGQLSGFTRSDALVLYLEASAWPAIEKALLGAMKPLRAKFRRGRPALTRKLGPGLAFAEDPGGGMSFGRSRCTVLAPALLNGLDQAEPQMVETLNHALRGAGIDPKRPWMGLS